MLIVTLHVQTAVHCSPPCLEKIYIPIYLEVRAHTLLSTRTTKNNNYNSSIAWISEVISFFAAFYLQQYQGTAAAQ